VVELEAMTRRVAIQREVDFVIDGGDRLAELYSTFGSGLDEPYLVAAREMLETTRHLA